MNITVLSGRLCADPELKTTPSGKSVVSVSVAVRRPYSKDTTDFFNIDAWEKTAEYIARFGRKGDTIEIVGTLTTRTYTDRDEKIHSVTSVLVNQAQIYSKQSNTATSENLPSQTQANADGIFGDDDLPF